MRTNRLSDQHGRETRLCAGDLRKPRIILRQRPIGEHGSLFIVRRIMDPKEIAEEAVDRAKMARDRAIVTAWKTERILRKSAELLKKTKPVLPHKKRRRMTSYSGCLG